MSEQQQEPWAPEGADRIGVAPRGEDQVGERGTSAHGESASDERGPAPGRDYFQENPGRAANNTGVTENSLEEPRR